MDETKKVEDDDSRSGDMCADRMRSGTTGGEYALYYFL